MEMRTMRRNLSNRIYVLVKRLEQIVIVDFQSLR